MLNKNVGVIPDVDIGWSPNGEHIAVAAQHGVVDAFSQAG